MPSLIWRQYKFNFLFLHPLGSFMIIYEMIPKQINISDNLQIMEQLQTIFWERNTDITLLKQEQKQMKKQQFQQRERMRIQRQNWILKIIKTIKTFSLENKRNIYASVLRMMSYYKDGISESEEIDYDKNFTEELINLFIKFYSECGIGDTSAIKKIVRPNNAFIIIDLVKQLVETHRQFYKVKLQQTYKQAPKLMDEKQRIKLPIRLQRRQLPITQPSEVDEGKKQKANENDQIHQKIKQAIFDKWQNFVSYGLTNQQNQITKMNDSYLQLLERNGTNNFMINKFQEKCFGRSRTFAYNIAGLYTNQQIKKMENKLKIDVKQKFANIRELKGDPSAEQLREYFKIKVQIQESYDKIESKKQNTRQINNWVPLVVQKSGMQHNPLNIYVIFAKQQVPLEEFAEKCGLSFKNYLRMIIKNKIEQNKEMKEIIELKNFKRHHFLDLNHAKKKELMTDQHRVYEKSKKQSIFPLLRSNQLRQDTQIALKNRSMSQYKLAPLFKNDLITRKLQLYENQRQISSPSLQLLKIQQEQNYTLDLHKLQKEKLKRKQSGKGGRSKIDNIIEMIMNQRNITMTN